MREDNGRGWGWRVCTPILTFPPQGGREGEGWVPACARTTGGGGRSPLQRGRDRRDVGRGMTWVGNGRFANRPYEGGKRDGEGGMATRFLGSAALRSE